MLYGSVFYTNNKMNKWMTKLPNIHNRLGYIMQPQGHFKILAYVYLS